MNIIAISVEFSAGHKIPYHPKCKRLHGHNYKVVVFVKGEVDKSGTLFDFGELKKIVKTYINDNYDHKTILYYEDELISKLSKEEVKIVDYIPTVENLSKALFYELKELISNIYKIRVYETSDCYAEYEEV